MVYILKEATEESLASVLAEIKKRRKETALVEDSLNGVEYQETISNEQKKKNLTACYGSLIRGIDGLEYQKAVRSEWD